MATLSRGQEHEGRAGSGGPVHQFPAPCFQNGDPLTADSSVSLRPAQSDLYGGPGICILTSGVGLQSTGKVEKHLLKGGLSVGDGEGGGGGQTGESKRRNVRHPNAHLVDVTDNAPAWRR